MADKIYKNDESMFADIKKSIDKTLREDIFDAVKEVELNHIDSEVLGVYDPIVYQRGISGGIDDENNIIGIVKDGVLEVDNITEFAKGYNSVNHGLGLVDLITQGDNGHTYNYDYAFRWNAPYMNSRDFIASTIEELDNTDTIEQALEKGLKKQGINLI